LYAVKLLFEDASTHWIAAKGHTGPFLHFGNVDGAPYWTTTAVLCGHVGASHKFSDHVRAHFFFGGDVLTPMPHLFVLVAFSARYSVIGERVPSWLQSRPFNNTSSCLYVSLQVGEALFYPDN
jgi:hypothetical protein